MTADFVLKLLESFVFPIVAAVAAGWVAWRLQQRYINDLTTRLDRAEERIQKLQDSLFQEMKLLIEDSKEQDIKSTLAMTEWLKEMRDWRRDLKAQYESLETALRGVQAEIRQTQVQNRLRG